MDVAGMNEEDEKRIDEGGLDGGMEFSEEES